MRFDLDSLGLEEKKLPSNKPNKRKRMIYSSNSKKFCKHNEVRIASSWLESIKLRDKGERWMSLREVDIICRNSPHPPQSAIQDPEVFFGYLRKFGCIVTEGDSIKESGIYHLRARYNNGLKKIKNANLERFSLPKKVEDNFLLLEGKMEELKLPIWEEEKHMGFPESLLKPENSSIQDWESKKRDLLKWLIDKGLV